MTGALRWQGRDPSACLGTGQGVAGRWPSRDDKGLALKVGVRGEFGRMGGGGGATSEVACEARWTSSASGLTPAS